MQFNIDGLPIYKSSNLNFWPILCKVLHLTINYKPYPVAIYCGPSKPKNVHDYFKDFVNEVSKLQIEGIRIERVQMKIYIHFFICDTPARVFVKCTKGHDGYNACERCIAYGQRINRKIVYPETNCRERTDENFRSMEFPDHHISLSPLLNIEPPIDMISHFPLDFMHLCCLGIMKKLINYLLDKWKIKCSFK